MGGEGPKNIALGKTPARCLDVSAEGAASPREAGQGGVSGAGKSSGAAEHWLCCLGSYRRRTCSAASATMAALVKRIISTTRAPAAMGPYR